MFLAVTGLAVALEDLTSVASGSQRDVSSIPATLEMLSPPSTTDATVSSMDDGDHYGDIGSGMEIPELTHDR